MIVNITSLPFKFLVTLVIKLGDNVGKSFRAVCKSVGVDVKVDK